MRITLVRSATIDDTAVDLVPRELPGRSTAARDARAEIAAAVPEGVIPRDGETVEV